MKLKEGDIVLTKGSWIVRWALRDRRTNKPFPFGHAVYYKGNGIIIEALSEEVMEDLLAKYFGEKVCICQVKTIYPIIEEDFKTVSRYIESQVGKKYAWLQTAYIYVKMLFHTLWLPSVFDRKDTFNCCEIISKGFLTIGVKFRKRIHPDNITPRDIYLSPITKVKTLILSQNHIA